MSEEQQQQQEQPPAGEEQANLTSTTASGSNNANNTNTNDKVNKSPTLTKAAFSHNPYGVGERIMHTPKQLPRQPGLPSGHSSLTTSPGLPGFTHPQLGSGAGGGYNSSSANIPSNPSGMASYNMQSPNDVSAHSQSGYSGYGGGATGGGGGGGQTLTSPNGSNTTPRLRFRWDPYSSSLRDDCASKDDGEIGGSGGGVKSKSTSMYGEAGLGSSSSPLMSGVSPGNTTGSPTSTSNANNNNASGTPQNVFSHVSTHLPQQQQRQGSSLIFHTTPSGSNQTAPLTIEDLLATSPHLAHVSPNGSPGLVSVDKRSLSSSHQNDGKQYFLDYSPVVSRAAPPVRQSQPQYQHHRQGSSPGLGSQGSPGPIGGRRPPAATVRIPTASTHMMMAGGADDFFLNPPEDVMPSLQLPDQEHPLPPVGAMPPSHQHQHQLPSTAYFPVHMDPFTSLHGRQQMPASQFTVGELGEITVTDTTLAPPPATTTSGLVSAYFPEDQALLEEITRTPSVFFGKMLPPPPPVNTLLLVCSLQSVYMNCTRYNDFIAALEGGDTLSSLGAGATGPTSPTASGKNSPHSKPKDRARRTGLDENSSSEGKKVPFSSLAPPPALPPYAVNTTAELEATRMGVLDWYAAAVTWWNATHGTPATDDKDKEGGDDETGGGSRSHRTSHSNRANNNNNNNGNTPDGKSLRGSATGRRTHNNNTNDSGPQVPATLRIDKPSPSVQSAVKAVTSGSVRRGDYGGGNNSNNNYYAHGSNNPPNGGGGRGFRGGRGGNRGGFSDRPRGAGRGRGGGGGGGGGGGYHNATDSYAYMGRGRGGGQTTGYSRYAYTLSQNTDEDAGSGSRAAGGADGWGVREGRWS